MEQIYEEAAADPTLLSSIDIDALVNKIGDNHYLEGKTLKEISTEIYEIISSLCLKDEIVKDFCMRLMGYRYVDRVCDLRNGQLIRWIKNGKLTNGGLLMNIKIENNGVLLLCKNNANRFFNVRFDDSVLFQKLSMEEQIVLMANSQNILE